MECKQNVQHPNWTITVGSGASVRSESSRLYHHFDICHELTVNPTRCHLHSAYGNKAETGSGLAFGQEQLLQIRIAKQAHCCQLPFLFWTYYSKNLWGWLKIKQCIMDKVILSSNKSQHECVFKDILTVVDVCLQKTAYFSLWTPVVPRNFFKFLLEICFGK